MATAENILAVYSDRGRRQLPQEGVYRNSGAMTPGSNKETVDAMSLEKIDRVIDVIRREAWRYNKTLSGTPQEGVYSPLLSNICLDKLDRFVEEVLLPKYNQGERRRNYPPYDDFAGGHAFGIEGQNLAVHLRDASLVLLN